MFDANPIATIRPDEHDIDPRTLAMLLRDYRPMRPDPPAMQREQLAELLRECWRPFHAERMRR